MARSQTLSQQPHLERIKIRTKWVLIGFAVCYVILLGRLGFLQVWRHSFYVQAEEAGLKNHSILPARRGMILDRNGDPLAINVPAIQIFADPVEFKDRADIPDIAGKLSVPLGKDAASIERALLRSPKSQYVSLLRHAPGSVGTQVKALQIAGIHVGPDTRRSYPNDGLAAQVLGFTDGDLKGIEGVERSEDAELEGTDGLMVGEVDQKGRFIPGTIRRSTEPRNGDDITLTLDKNLQSCADEELAVAVKEHHALKGVVVVMDPSNGEILALSNAPGYDPNQPRPMAASESIASQSVNAARAHAVPAYEADWRDGAVSDLYEPGSTLKTITAAAVLQEEGLDAEHIHVYCNGAMRIGGHTIHCAPDPPHYGVHGDEDLRGVLRDSCNIGMAQFGITLGQQKLYEYEQKFGLLDYPHSGLPGETHAHLLNPSSMNHFTGKIGWSKVQLANISFGQGIAVTPLQLANAYCAIANGGQLMHPHIVRSINDGENIHLTPTSPVRQVLTSDVAAEMRSMLGTVVLDGTGKPAQIAGFSVGGKTGSAQVAGPRGYESGHYVASFIGMAPLSNPRVVILCAVFQPEGEHWGATVAAPVVHNLAKRAMIELHLLPDAPTAVDWDDHLHIKHPKSQVTTVHDLMSSAAVVPAAETLNDSKVPK